MKHSRLRYRLAALAAGLGLMIGFVPIFSGTPTTASAATPGPIAGITLRVISGAGGSTGLGLVEVYEVSGN